MASGKFPLALCIECVFIRGDSSTLMVPVFTEESCKVTLLFRLSSGPSLYSVSLIITVFVGLSGPRFIEDIGDGSDSSRLFVLLSLA